MKRVLPVSFVVLVSFTCISVGYLASNFERKFCDRSVPAHDMFGRNTVKVPDAVDRSYVLFSPIAMDQFFAAPGHVYLTDLHGRIAHEWKTRYQTLYASLKKNGNLVAALIKPNDLLANPGGGGTGIIQELDWDGKIVWEYENPMMHHDFDVLPDGGIAVLVWEKILPENAVKIRGGMKIASHHDAWGDAVIEIDTKGNEVWRWSASKNLDIAKYTLGPLTPWNEWTHANSVRYYKTNPFTGKPAYLASFRHLNRVFMIERESGRVIWESKENMLAFQHDATLLSSGHILVFDNGLFRISERPGLWSRVVEIDPLTNTIVWEFNGGKVAFEKTKFSASIMSGAQRLHNGNTFIVTALNGHFLEVTVDQRIVWDFVNPYFAVSSGAFENNTVFKARRYSSEDVDWPEELPDPTGTALERFCEY